MTFKITSTNTQPESPPLDIQESEGVKDHKITEVFHSRRLSEGANESSSRPLSQSRITSEGHRQTCELAQRLVESKLNLLDPDVFKDFSPSLRLEIAKCYAAREYAPLLLGIIKAYEITNQNDVCEVMTKISYLDTFDMKWIIQFESYGITDQQKRFEIIKHIASSRVGYWILFHYENFKFLNPHEAFEIMKIIARCDKYNITSTRMNNSFKELNNFIKDPKEKYAIACILISRKDFEWQALGDMKGLIKNLDQDQRFQLAQIAAQFHGDNPTVLSACINRCGIIDPVQLNQLYQTVIVHSGWETFKLAAASGYYSPRFALRFIPEDKKQEFCQAYLDNFAGYPSARNNFEGFRGIAKVLLPSAFVHVKALAIQAGMPAKTIDLIESRFAGLDNLLQREKDITWLGMLMMHYLLDKNLPQESPLFDEAALPLLLSIWNISDSILRKEATRVLLSVYSSPEKKELVKNLMEVNKKHLDLVILFSVQAGIQKSAITDLLTELSTTTYKDIAITTPVIEILCALGKTQLLSTEKIQELLKLVFNTPVKGERESKTDYNRRLDQYRNNQPDYVSALHAMLYFHQEAPLNEIKDTATLVDKWKTLMFAIFHIDASLIPQFMNTFGQSSRYPGALCVYATRLQILPDGEREDIMPLLGKFARAILDGTYPKIRYSFEDNIHLETLFSNDKALLEKWQTALPIKIDRSAHESTIEETPQQQVQRLTQQALVNGHLGKDQDSLYPELKTILSGNLLELTGIAPGVDESDRKRVRIILSCAKLLNLKSDFSQLKTALSDLQKLLPDEVQFKQDVKDMLKELSIPKPADVGQWTIVDSDAWEDMLLMGAEVAHSCQNITGSADLNKCLLAYLLDGKNRIMVAKDPSGKIVGRAVLRILWDKIQKKPVLFVEQLYTRGGNFQRLQRDILEGCKQKAQAMGLPLVTGAHDYKSEQMGKYPESLYALGGPAPFEYVDALANIESDGCFSLKDCYFLSL